VVVLLGRDWPFLRGHVRVGRGLWQAVILLGGWRLDGDGRLLQVEFLRRLVSVSGVDGPGECFGRERIGVGPDLSIGIDCLVGGRLR
jgi:hypothetical protein